MTIFIPIVGFLCTTMALLIGYPTQGKTGRLENLYTIDQAQILASMDPRIFEYRLLASGLNIKPFTFRAICLSISIAVLILVWLFLPGLPALMLASLMYFIPGIWLDDRIKNRGREIDCSLPIAIGRISAGLLAGGSIPDVLQQAGESLEIEKKNPLTPELLFTASEMRIKDRVEALRALAARSPSVSLANLAQLLEGYSEAGGRAYSNVLMDISTRVQQILMARNRAQAKAGDSLVSAKVLPAVLFLILLYLGQDPMIRSSLSAFPVQIVISISIAAMVGGYLLIRSMIMEAV